MSKSTKRNLFAVCVKLITNRTFGVMVGPLDTVATLKQRILEREGIPLQQQKLMVTKTLLEPDTRPLSNYNLKAGDLVNVTVGYRTGSVTRSIEPGAVAGTVTPRDSNMQLKSSDTKAAASTVITDTAMTVITDAAMNEALTSDETKAKSPIANTLSPFDTIGTARNVASSSSSGSSDANQNLVISTPTASNIDISKTRASAIQQFATVNITLKPHADAAAKTGQTLAAQPSAWPRQSQAYCVYTRPAASGEVTGIISFGLSNPYQTNFYFAIGIGIEIVLEAPTAQARLAGANGVVSGNSIADSWMFTIVHEIAHQCFALGLQIRQLLEKSQLLSVEIAGINLPPEFLDPETGRCCVLLGHLNDPDVPRGCNVTVPHQHQWILQSVLFVTARLLTFAQCQMIRKEGAEARRKLAESFVKAKTYHICDVPVKSWSELQAKQAASSGSASSSAAAKDDVKGTAPAKAMSSSTLSSTVAKNTKGATTTVIATALNPSFATVPNHPCASSAAKKVKEAAIVAANNSTHSVAPSSAAAEKNPSTRNDNKKEKPTTKHRRRRSRK